MMMLDEILSGKCPVAWDGSSFSGRKWEARFAPDCDSLGSECDKTYIHLSTRSYQSPGARHIDLYNIIKSFFNCTNIQLTGGHVQGGGFLISLWPKNGQLAFFQCPAYLWQGDNVVNCLGLFGGCKSCPDFSPAAGRQHQWLTPERLGNQVTHHYLLLSGKILQKRFLLATCFGPSFSKAWSTADSSTQSSLFINLLLLSPSSSSICRHHPIEDWRYLVDNLHCVVYLLGESSAFDLQLIKQIPNDKTERNHLIWGIVSDHVAWWKQQLLPCWVILSHFSICLIILLMVRRYICVNMIYLYAELKQVKQFAPCKKAGECVCPPDGRRCSSSPQNSAAAVVRLASSKQWTAKPTGSRLQLKKADSTKIRLPLKISCDKKWQLERE